MDKIKDIVCKNVLKMCCSDWIYVLAISLQLAGALILIIYFFKNTKKEVRRLYVQEVGGLGVVEHGKVTFKAGRLRKCAQQVFGNRISFLYIFFGYCFGIYGEIKVENRNIILILSIIITFLLIFLGKGFAFILSFIIYRKDEYEDYKKAKEETGSDANVVIL